MFGFKGSDQILWLLLLLAFSSKRGASSSSSSSSPRRSPGSSLPPEFRDKLDPSSLETLEHDLDLFKEPESPGPDDMLWAQYAGDARRGGATLSTLDLDTSTPITRKLTRFELWALAPYFPVDQDLDVMIHNGRNPPAPAHVDPKLWAELQPGIIGWTSPVKPHDIWFPNSVRPLWSRWWLAVLAHELSHRSQIRMGMEPVDAVEAVRKHGYINSPIERQARWLQRKVLDDLPARARRFYESPH